MCLEDLEIIISVSDGPCFCGCESKPTQTHTPKPHDAPNRFLQSQGIIHLQPVADARLKLAKIFIVCLFILKSVLFAICQQKEVKPQSCTDLLVFVFGRMGSKHISYCSNKLKPWLQFFLFGCSHQILPGFKNFQLFHNQTGFD